jgi:hypothetical protein
MKRERGISHTFEIDNPGHRKIFSANSVVRYSDSNGGISFFSYCMTKQPRTFSLALRSPGRVPDRMNYAGGKTFIAFTSLTMSIIAR